MNPLELERHRNEAAAQNYDHEKLYALSVQALCGANMALAQGRAEWAHTLAQFAADMIRCDNEEVTRMVEAARP